MRSRFVYSSIRSRSLRPETFSVEAIKLECVTATFVRKTMEHAILVYLALALVAYPFLFLIYEIWRHGGRRTNGAVYAWSVEQGGQFYQRDIFRERSAETSY